MRLRPSRSRAPRYLPMRERRWPSMPLRWPPTEARPWGAASNSCLCSSPFEHRGKESIGGVDVRVEPEVVGHPGHLHALFLEHVLRRNQLEVGMRAEEVVDDVLVLLGDQAAGSIQEPAP